MYKWIRKSLWRELEHNNYKGLITASIGMNPPYCMAQIKTPDNHTYTNRFYDWNEAEKWIENQINN